MALRTKKPVAVQVYMNESKSGRPTYSNWMNVDEKGDEVYCCGCGLMHRTQYRFSRGVLQMRTKEVASSTKKMRAYMKRKKEGVFGNKLTSWS